jgi:hypothetical protein
MKGKKLALILSIAAVITVVPNNARAASSNNKTTATTSISKSLSVKTNVDVNKDLTITFNKAININNIDKSLITVKDENGNNLNVTLVPGEYDTQMVVKSPSDGYDYNTEYTLTVAKGKYGKLNLETPYTLKFKTKEKEKTNDELAKEIYGDINLAHEVYLDYVKDTQHDKDKFYENETWCNYQCYEQYGDYNLKFMEKYLNKPEYAHVTDLNYYQKIKGLTINFDKVNNSNRHLQLHNLPKSMWQYPNRNDIYEFNYINPYIIAIWRPDTAKEILDEINKNRVQRGLKELKLDPDLTAISMWGAKRSYINQVCDDTLQPYRLGEDEGFNFFSIVYNNQAYYDYVDRSKRITPPPTSDGASWAKFEIISGTTPMVPKYAENFSTGGDEGAFELYYNTQLEKDLTKYFDYDKPIRLINYATPFDYNGEKIVKRLSERNRIGRDNSSPYRWANYGTNRVFNDEIYNDKIENIGVGVIYEKAGNGLFNGAFVIYIIVS